MERVLLHHFLRSGPARKFDVSAVTRRIALLPPKQHDLLFRSPYCNSSILFKCINFEESHQDGDIKPIDMLVYMPYDHNNPGDGGESFHFTEHNFWQYFITKLRSKHIDMTTLQADYARLIVFDSIPTFSPFILELAFERANLPIPRLYLDLPPELRTRLREYIKERIRPLTVAAFAHNDQHAEHAVDDLTDKMLSLRSIEDIMPLIIALRIPKEDGITLLSAWIGITYFEYEYGAMQRKIKKFACWLNEFSMPRESLRESEKKSLESFVKELRTRIRADWGVMVNLWRNYVSSYEAFVLHDNVEEFSAFLRQCNAHYWRLADILGRLEQTVLTWQHYTRNYFNVPLPYFRLMELYAVLRRLHLSDERAAFLSLTTVDEASIVDASGWN